MSQGRDSNGTAISRREAIRLGLVGGAALLFADHLGIAALVPTTQGTLSGSRPAAKGKAKAVIQIWMWGGPAHLDTFDPKPEAGYDYCGPLDKPIATNVAGIRIC